MTISIWSIDPTESHSPLILQILLLFLNKKKKKPILNRSSSSISSTDFFFFLLLLLQFQIYYGVIVEPKGQEKKKGTVVG